MSEVGRALTARVKILAWLGRLSSGPREALPTLDLLPSIKRTELSWELWLTVKECLIILNAWRASSFSKLSFFNLYFLLLSFLSGSQVGSLMQSKVGTFPSGWMVDSGTRVGNEENMSTVVSPAPLCAKITPGP